MLVRDLFYKQAESTSEAVGLVFEGGEFSYGELDERSNRLATGLINIGFAKGDKVAGLIPNSTEFVITYLAMMKAGIIFIPLNTRLLAADVEYILNHSESTGLIYHKVFRDTITHIRSCLRWTERFIEIGDAPVKDTSTFEKVIDSGSNARPDSSLGPDDEALYLYTAGTTGDPKGVIHLHSSCAFVGAHWAKVFGMKEGESLLVVLPLFHAFGIHCCMMPALISGAKIVLMPGFNAEEALMLIERHRITILQLVPAMGTLIINHPEISRYDLSSLRELMMGGSLVPHELLKAWRERFPYIRVTNAYGQTESCPCATGYWDRDVLEKPGSVGKPWKEVSLKIVDELGEELEDGRVGEIVYRVPSIMKGYYKEPELTERTVQNGWLYSGDLGYMDKDGYVYIVDRKKDIIIRGGENISSMEVEEVLHRHPAVLEAAAIGTPDPVLGEVVTAVVVVKEGHRPSEEELKKHCSRYLADFKRPSRVIFTDILPRNPGGKVLKRILKERYGARPG